MRSVGKFIGLGVIAALLVGPAAPARAQDALNPPMPLARPTSGGSMGSRAVTIGSAQRAQELGMSSLAADLYRELRAAPGADRVALTLALANALLEAGQPEEAQKALDEIPEPRSAGWHLRRGLVAMQLRQYDAVRAVLNPVLKDREGELSAVDLPWYWLLQGAFVDVTAPLEEKRSNDFYNRAQDAATNEMAYARFQLQAEYGRFRRNVGATPEQVQAARVNSERLQGTFLGYSYTQTYALMLVGREQKSEAMTFLQTILPAVPPTETRWWDDLRLTLGVIGDRGRSLAGRRALSELLEGGHDAKRQRQALQMLWEASRTEPARTQLRDLLDKLIAAPSKHRVRESLLYYRAQLALLEREHERASASANTLLTEFPGSELRVHTYGLLTQLAWEQRRYRLAADHARRARAEMAALTQPAQAAARAELGVLEAEAWFRAGAAAGDRNDFRNAADAYAATLRDPPANVKPGDLMFQRVLAEIKAGSDDAVKVLDELAKNPAFDVENRWQAEWSLARALLARQKTAAAYARVDALLNERAKGAGVNPGLAAKLAWLRVRLALEERQLEPTLVLADALVGSLADFEPALRTEIASTTLLQKARAQFELRREPDALATLTKVRADFPRSEAAMTSYLIEADFFAAQGQIDKAQRGLTSLTDNPLYKDSVFVLEAYFQLALWSEQLGQEKDLKAANGYIERLVKLVEDGGPATREHNELFFHARMKQGELLRKLNQFPQAQRVYDDLQNRPASTENLILARLELARTHNAQATTDATHAERAQLLFEELCNRVDAWPDVRVEAGYYLGALLISRGKSDQGVKVWWTDVIDRFLLSPEAPPIEAGAKRAYWLSRTLIDLGELQWRQGNLEDAKKAFGLVLEKNLGAGEDLAAQALDKLGVRKAPR